MKNKRIIALAVAVALIAALSFLAFRQAKPSANEAKPAEAAKVNANVASEEAGSAASRSGDLAGSDPKNLAPTEGGQSGAAQSGGTSRPGPTRMSEDNIKRVAVMSEKLKAANPSYADLMTLLETEGRDDAWSPQIESNFDVALRSYGPGYSGLEVDDVRCGKSVCVIHAVVKPGFDPSSPSADWSGLISNTFGESWFGENFIDTRTTVGDDATGTVYISVFERKH